MSGISILIFLVLVSAIPAIAVYLWFRLAHYPFTPIRFLACLLAGAAAFFPALFFQRIFPPGAFDAAGKLSLFARIFIHAAGTEELGRFIVLSVFFWAAERLTAKTAAGSPISLAAIALGSAAGLAAGIGFAILESAAYGASDAGVILLRAVTAAPLHGACGARVGAAAVLFRCRPAQALFRFLSAVAIHGVYNFMIGLPGFPSIAAILIAFSALASSALSIHGALRGEN
jgi:RsiW-degrading membrane proteinase PrsW (M82 family)